MANYTWPSEKMRYYRTRSFQIKNYNLNSCDVYERNKDKIQYIEFEVRECPIRGVLYEDCHVYFTNPRNTGERALHEIMFLFKGYDIAIEPLTIPFKPRPLQYTMCLGEPPQQGVRNDLINKDFDFYFTFYFTFIF